MMVMRVSLSIPGRTVAFGVIALTLGFALTGVSIVQYLASYLASRGDLSGLQTAISLAPGNANYHDLLGHYLFFVQQSPGEAMRSYEKAAALNPYVARFWLDQAAIYKLLDNADAQQTTIERALAAEPTNPGIAWEAASLFRMRGQNHEALQQLRRGMAGDNSRVTDAIELAWEINPDVNSLLLDTIPPQPLVYCSLIHSLNSKGKATDAYTVWTGLLQLRQPLNRPRVLAYLDSLLRLQDVTHAELVWQQAAPFCDLERYQPSDSNLVVNGDFSFDVLNAGFDWRYEPRPDVTLSLDPSETHGSERSLSITFDGQPVSGAGLRQLIPVLPNSEYQFSAYSKTQDLQGAGGPRFQLQDAFNQETYFAGEPLTEAGFWKQTAGVFRTGSSTRLLVLRVQRFPEKLPIKGKLWISGVRLSPMPPL